MGQRRHRVRRLVRGSRGPDLRVPGHLDRWILEIVQGLEIDDLSRGKIDASVAELAEERDAVSGLDLI